ncbi:MAG: hypothetical protein NTV84_04640 [Methanoregula sp.]|nr:hypothetical protein [Methanoregula sp.]
MAHGGIGEGVESWCEAGLYRWSGERHPDTFVSGEFRAAGECGGCARAAGAGGACWL